MTQKKHLMSETVYRALRDIIVGRRFEPGQRVNVEELARELGVSRTPVWEAMRRLGQEGILKNIPNRGVFMAEKPLVRVREILQVRFALDRLACGLAARNVSSRTLGKLVRCFPEQLAAIETSDTAAYYVADVRFHRLICEATGNAYLKALYESITTHVFPTHFNILDLLPSLYVAHQEIVAGLSEHDAEKVDRAVGGHIDLVMNHLERQVTSEVERKAIMQRIKEDSSQSAAIPRRRKRKALSEPE